MARALGVKPAQRHNLDLQVTDTCTGKDRTVFRWDNVTTSTDSSSQVCYIDGKVLPQLSQDSFEALYEKCNYLRARSVALRQEARELCTVSHSLRQTNAMIAYGMRVIKASGVFMPSDEISDEARMNVQDHHVDRRLRG